MLVNRRSGPRVLRQGIPGVIVTLVIVVGGLSLNGYGKFEGQTALITAIVTLSLGVVMGRGGMISLCQMAFAGLGAWVAIWLGLHAPGIPFLVDVLLCGLVMLPVSLLVSLPALRVRGINLAIITLAFAVTVDVVLTANGFPGASNLFALPRPHFLATDSAYMWFCAAVFGIFAAALWLIDRTRIGASWSAVRHDERAAAALGRSVPRTKLSAFALSALMAGVAGALFAGQLGTVTEVTFAPLTSLTAFAVAVMVGARYVEGALLAGVIAAWLPQLLQDYNIPQDYANLLFGVGAMVGLIGGAGAAEALRRGGRRLFTPSSAVESGLVGEEDPARGPSLAAEAGSLNVLEVRDLTVHYGAVTALDGVSLAVPRGSVVALIGPNGAGKSTLIDAVSGFGPISGGTIELMGRDISGLPPHRRARAGLRRSFQQDRTIPDLSIERYARLSRQASAPLGDGPALEEILAYFGCPPSDTPLARVDVGTRRLIEIAAALAGRPALLLLDEPAAGLGAPESKRLAARISQIPQRFGASVLLVEHDMDLVQVAASQLVVLDYGVVIAAGEPASVLREDKVIRAYLGEEIHV